LEDAAAATDARGCARRGEIDPRRAVDRWATTGDETIACIFNG
jgi:hypothetical protein